MDYAQIKAEAKTRGVSVRELYTLAPSNDPFYLGKPREMAMAQWFADLWQRFGYTTGVHVRRVHYQMISQEGPTKADGSPYANTENDWTYMTNASKYARYLGLVPKEAFIDRRNPAPHLFADYDHERDGIGWELDDEEWRLPRMESFVFLTKPTGMITGYDYHPSDQPHHVEVWVEKSTMNDELVPICRRYSANLVTGVGEMSITATLNLLSRIDTANRPARIFYVSDFDPAGYDMPKSVSRKVEFLSEGGMDIKLDPIVLTREQVRQYRLPRTPIKETEKRKGQFEDSYGVGAVELDALEALHPGVLGEIITGHILRYRDDKLSDRLRQQDADAQSDLDYEMGKALDPFEKDLDELTTDIEACMARHQRFNEEMQPLRERAAELRRRMREAVDPRTSPIRVDLNGRWEPEVPGDDERDWLYDSARDYFAQLGAYHRHSSGSDPGNDATDSDEGET